MDLRRRGIARIVLALAAFVTSASAVAAAVIDFSQGQWRRAVLEINETTELPFLLWLPNGEGDAVIRNGEEDIRVDFTRRPPRPSVNDDVPSFTLDFPHYDSRIDAQFDATNEWRGQWTKMRSDGVARVKFRLDRRLEAPSVAALFPPPNDDWFVAHWPMKGDWAMDFAKSGVARGEFRSRQTGAAEVEGTVLTPTGDYRFLSGVPRIEREGDRLTPRFQLSVFDGAHAFLFTGELRGDKLVGDFHSGNWWHETFTARRLGPDEAFELPDPFSEVALTSGDGKLHLEELDEPRYQGKPVIVQIFGTWCPNCHDETPVLRDLYERYRDDGLEVLGLAYEVTGDDARSRRQVERFKEKYGIDWEIVIAGTSDKAQASKTLPDISAVKSFPTTIWIGRDGKVRAIHSGFAGPATGTEHVQLVREFERLTEGIVGEE